MIPNFGGDLSGAYTSAFVSGLQGRAVASTMPNANEVLRWNNTLTRWEPSALVDNVGITALTGDVSASGTGAVGATLANGVVTTPKMFATPGANRLVATDGTTGATLVPFVCNLNESLQWTASGWACVNPATAFLANNVIVDGGNARGAAISIGTSDNFALQFKTNNTNKVTILPNGNAGIATTAPSQALTVAGTVLANNFQSGFNTPAAPGYGSGTTGVFIPNATTLGFSVNSNERMRIENSGNVGIGTTASLSKLDVSGSIGLRDSTNGWSNSIIPNINVNGLARALRFDNSTGSTTEGFQFYNSTAGQSLMFIQQNGLVGIGTTSPQSTLDVNGSITTNTQLVFTGAARLSKVNAADLGIRQQASTVFQDLSGNPLAVITQAGNLGIGTTTPNRLLKVAGPIRIANTALPASPAVGDIAIDSGAGNTLKYHNGASWISLTAGGTGDFKADGSVAMTGGLRHPAGTAIAPGLTFNGDTDNGIFSPASDNVAITTAGTERMRVLPNGRIGIGITNPTENFVIAGDPGNFNMMLDNTSSDGGSNQWRIAASGSSWGSGDNSLVFTYDTAFSAAAAFKLDGGNGLASFRLQSQPLGSNYGSLTLQSTTAQGAGVGSSIAFSAEDGANSDRTFALIGGRKENGTSGNYDGFFNIGTRANGTGVTEHFRITSAGYAGIGTVDPKAKLDVSGGVRIGDMTTCVSATNAGTIRFNSGNLQICAAAGNTWTTLSTGGGDFLANGSVPMTGSFRSIAGTAAAPGITFAGDTDNGIFAPAADNIAISTSGSEKMRVLANGNVGIGTSLPFVKLSVLGDGFFEGGRVSAATTSGGATMFTNGSYGYFATNNPTYGLRLRVNDLTGTAEGITVIDGGNVGIGNLTPSRPLSVNGTMSLAPSALPSSPVAGDIAIDSGASNTLKYHNGTAWISVTPSSNSIYVDGAGNVAIGHTAPNQIFDVRKAQNATTALQIANGHAGISAESAVNFGNDLYTASGYISYSSSVAGNLMKVVNAQSGPIAFSANGGERLRITPTGDVGVGTNAPLGKLDVRGGATLMATNDFTSTTGSALAINQGSTSGNVNVVVQQFNNGVTGAGHMIMQPSGGFVGIGTSNPIFKLHVAGGVSNAIFTTTDFNNGVAGSAITIGQTAPAGNTHSVMQTYQSGGNATGVLDINPYGGNVTFGAGGYGGYSNLVVNGGITTVPYTSNLIFDNISVGTMNTSYVHVISNNPIATNRTMCLLPGSPGQHLTIANANNNAFELQEGTGPCSGSPAVVDNISGTVTWSAQDDIHEYVYTMNNVWKQLY